MENDEDYEVIREYGNKQKEEIEETTLKEKRKVETKKKKEIGKLKDTIIVILFLIWFVGSFCAMFITAELENESLVVVAFGQYFAVFSLLFFAADGSSLMPLIHYTVGVCCMVIPPLVSAQARLSDLQMKDKLILGSFLLAIIMTYVLIIGKRNKKINRIYYSIAEFLLLIYGVVGIICWCY